MDYTEWAKNKDTVEYPQNKIKKLKTRKLLIS